LKNERSILIDKSDSLAQEYDQSDTDEQDIYKEIELICEQIRNHYHEINIIQQNIQIEIQESSSEYRITLDRDKIQYINGLPGQKRQFSLCWFYEKDKNKVTEPDNIIHKKHSINVPYATYKSHVPLHSDATFSSIHESIRRNV